MQDINHIKVFQASGLLQDKDKLRLHLGCGREYFDDYINIDFPQKHHNVIKVHADFYIDIRQLKFPPGCIDEIRLHHVFEHFGRVDALALLIKWHSWLKVGGLLRIETPDIINSAKTLLSSTSSWQTKMGAIRHLSGDQTTQWGYHVDHWFADRFKYTLAKLGFGHISTVLCSWKYQPYLSNVEVSAIKQQNVAFVDQLTCASKLLQESIVSSKEISTYKVWISQLYKLFEEKQTE